VVAVWVAVFVGELVAVLVAVLVTVFVDVLVDVTVAVDIGVPVIVLVGVAVLTVGFVCFCSQPTMKAAGNNNIKNKEQMSFFTFQLLKKIFTPQDCSWN
jgi:hypothetical protein